jgi:methyl-accepting chemotaxis protein
MVSLTKVFRFRRLGARLGAAFGVLLAIMLLMAAGAAAQLLRIQLHNEESALHTDRLVIVARWAALVRSNLDRALTTARMEAAAGDDVALGAKLSTLTGRLVGDMATAAEATAELQDAVNALSVEPKVAALIARVTDARIRFVALRAKVRDDLRMGGDPGRIDSELVPVAAAMVDALDDLGAHLEARARAANEALSGVVARAKLLLALSCLVALAVGAVLAWLATRSVTAPMRDAVMIAQNIANGDLSQPFESDRPDEIGSMLRRLAQMQGRLRATLAQIRLAAQGIRQASTEVAVGNQDLSARTEQTASNLQETASSMQQLTEGVAQSAAAAELANRLAGTAAQVAARGGRVVTEVIATMNEIDASSKKISDIIGVIDGISFQTNILALNAAVEAARAGEQGRGFAVVAGEVRSLAQRSAQAAHEIKALIAASAEKVESGGRLAHEAGQTMDEIVTSVGRVTEMIAEISSAAADQNTGISQVGLAVANLDEMTRQNAALVEHSAAAAESLKLQATQLADAVAVFRLGEAQYAAV